MEIGFPILFPISLFGEIFVFRCKMRLIPIPTTISVSDSLSSSVSAAVSVATSSSAAVSGPYPPSPNLWEYNFRTAADPMGEWMQMPWYRLLCAEGRKAAGTKMTHEDGLRAGYAAGRIVRAQGGSAMLTTDAEDGLSVIRPPGNLMKMFFPGKILIPYKSVIIPKFPMIL